ncbi:MAG: LamG-like jellyroll fold domain-containing protein [Vicinamibacterales bacterium]
MNLPETSDRLDSWKEIAAFLGRTVRTVQRWEKTAGLPVRRGGPGSRGSVVASKTELAEWWERRSPNLAEAEGPDEETATVPPTVQVAPSSKWWLPSAALVLLAGGVVAFAWLGRPTSPPASAQSLGRFLARSTSEGGALSIIPLGSVPSGVAVPRSGDRFHIGLPEERVVATVDVVQRTIVDRIPAGGAPTHLLLSPDETTVFAGHESGITVIDRRTRNTRVVGTGGPVHHLAISSDGQRVWVTLAQAGLKVLDVSRSLLTPVPTVGCPMFLAPPIIDRQLFVSYQCGGPGGRSGHDALEIVDEPSRRSLLTRHGPPLVGSRLALSPDGQYLWADIHDACVAVQYDHDGCVSRGPGIHVLRASSLERLATHAVPATTTGTVLTFVPDGSRVIVGTDGVHVLDSQLGHTVESLRLAQAGELALRTDARRLVIGTQKSVAVFSPDSGSDARVVAGAVTYWTGDGTANDVAGGTHGSRDDIRFEPGRLGQAFSFSGVRGVEFGRRIDVDLIYRPSTYLAWIKPSRLGHPMSILSRASFAGWDWRLTADARLAFCLTRAPAHAACANDGLITSSSIEPGKWRHVALVRGPDSLRLFVDGRLEAEASLAGYVPPPSANYDEEPIMRLGAGRTRGFEFEGLIDEVVMFGRALDVEEIARVMQATVDKNPERP